MCAARYHGDPADNIQFSDVAMEAGVHFVLENDAAGRKYQIEPMTGGVALLDYDRDGLLDIYFCNGAEIPSLEKTDKRFFNRLYRNLGRWRFEDVTEKAGVAGSGYSMGASSADYDGDGWSDLYVTGVNRNILYRNRGDGTFEDTTKAAGATGVIEGYGKAWSVGSGWFDYDRDGDLDLFVVNYCVWTLEKDPYCGVRMPGHRTYCHPKHYDPLPNILYRNDGNGSFVDVSERSGIGAHEGKGMGIAFADYDRDGFPDVFVANDGWRNFLFRNAREGTFEEVGLWAGVAYVDSGRPVSGMGVDFQDSDGDGFPDLFLTALSNETFPLFRNLGNGLFRDETNTSGLESQTLPWSGWSTGMVDFNNDGRLDLFTAGSHVQTNEELYSGRRSRQSNRVFLNLGNSRFRDITTSCGPDFQKEGFHRGAAFGDLDNDGRVDVVVSRINEPAEVFRNEAEPVGHWLLLDLEAGNANRSGLGTRVTAKLPSGQTLVRHVNNAVGYASSSDRRLHLGLGEQDKIEEIEITWPDRSLVVLRDLELDRILRVRQNSGSK